MSALHERFDILNANGLVKGANVDCREGGSKEIVHNSYVVTEATENELIQLASTPSIIYDRATGRKIGASNAFVYFDFEALGEKARLTQTIVIDLMHPVYKALGDVMRYLTGSRRMWNEHFREELESLKAHIEGAAPRRIDPNI